MSSSSSGTSSSRTISSHAPGTSMGKEMNWMPMPSIVVVSHTFSIAAPIENTE